MSDEVPVIPADWSAVWITFRDERGFVHCMRHEGDDYTGYVVWCRCGWSSGSRTYETGAVESATHHRVNPGNEGTPAPAGSVQAETLCVSRARLRAEIVACIRADREAVAPTPVQAAEDAIDRLLAAGTDTNPKEEGR